MLCLHFKPQASIPINRLTLVYLNGNLLVLHSPNAYEKLPFGNIHWVSPLSSLWPCVLLVRPLWFHLCCESLCYVPHPPAHLPLPPTLPHPLPQVQSHLPQPSPILVEGKKNLVMPFIDSTPFLPHKFRSVKNFNDKHGLKVRLILVENSSSAVYHSLVLDKLLNFSEPHFSHLLSKDYGHT